MALEEKGFFGALFDFSFSSFVTTKLIKVLYVLVIVLSALGAIGILGGAVYRSPAGAVIGVILAGLMFFVWVLVGRVWLELVIVIFRIAENVGEIAKQKGGGAASAK